MWTLKGNIRKPASIFLSRMSAIPLNFLLNFLSSSMISPTSWIISLLFVAWSSLWWRWSCWWSWCCLLLWIWSWSSWRDSTWTSNPGKLACLASTYWVSFFARFSFFRLGCCLWPSIWRSSVFFELPCLYPNETCRVDSSVFSFFSSSLGPKNKIITRSQVPGPSQSHLTIPIPYT